MLAPAIDPVTVTARAPGRLRAGSAQLAAHAADLRSLGPAYAVAVGGATGESPFAEGKGRFAWSRRDGNWCRIRIVDSPSLTFGWSPGTALLSIVGILVDMWLRLEVTPKLGHVRSAEIVEQ